MKKILLLIAMWVILIPCTANAAETTKEDLPIMIINNSWINPGKFEAKTKKDLPPILAEQFHKTLGEKYRVVEMENTENINDVVGIERADIIALFPGAEYKIAILAEIMPIHPVSRFFAAAKSDTTVHIKIVDIQNNKYLYNGKLQALDSSARQAIKKINVQLDKVLQDTLLTTEKPSS